VKPFIQIDDQALARFCEDNHIRRLALFGSVVRGELRSDSDVDVLVEFEPGYVPGFAFIALQDELSALIGRRVDLHTPNSLSRDFRADVLREAQVRYAAPAAA
jgi:predicted nucleotidyltransferase